MLLRKFRILTIIIVILIITTITTTTIIILFHLLKIVRYLYIIKQQIFKIIPISFNATTETLKNPIRFFYTHCVHIISLVLMRLRTKRTPFYLNITFSLLPKLNLFWLEKFFYFLFFVSLLVILWNIGLLKKIIFLKTHLMLLLIY